MASQPQKKSLDDILGFCDDIFGEESSQSSPTSSLEDQLAFLDPPSSPKKSKDKTDTKPFAWLAEKLRNSSSKFSNRIRPLFNDDVLPNCNNFAFQRSSNESYQSQKYLENLLQPERSPDSRFCEDFSKLETTLQDQPSPQWEDVPCPENIRSILKTEPPKKKKGLRFKKRIRHVRLYPLVADSDTECDSTDQYWSYIDIRRRDEHLIKDIMDPNRPDRVQRRANEILRKRRREQIFFLDKLIPEAKTKEEVNHIKYLKKIIKEELHNYY